MKRIIIALLSCVLIFSLVACGGKKKGDTIKEDASNPENSEEAEKNLNETKEQQEDDKVDILLADTENVKITCRGKGKSAFGGIYITLEVINKTDKDIRIGVDKTSNDGVMVNALFGETVVAGMKAESDLSAMDNELTEVKNFKGIFNVVDDSNGEIIEDNIEFTIE